MPANFIPIQPTLLNMTFEWLTQVHGSYSAEKRDQLRLFPRLVAEVGFEVDEKQTRLLTTILLSNDEFLFPDWRYQQRTSLVRITHAVNPTVIQFSVNTAAWPAVTVGDTVMLYKNETEYEEVTITSVSGGDLQFADIPSLDLADWTVLPAYAAVIKVAPTWDTVGNTTTTCTVTFASDDYPDNTGIAAALPTFNGNVILARPDLRVGTPQYPSFPKAEIVDAVIGQVRSETVRSRSLVGRVHTETASNQQEMLTLENVFHLLAGKVTPFYKPSHLPDFIPTDIFIDRSTVVTTPNPKVFSDDVRFIYITRDTGEKVPAQVTGVTATSGALTLHLSAALTFDPVADNIARISAMELHRLDTDDVTISVGPGITGTVLVPTREVNQ